MQKQLLENDEKIRVLKEQHETILAQLSELTAVNDFLRNSIDEKYSKSIPKTLSKLSQEQVDWLLENSKSTFRYNFSKALFEIYGWNAYGKIEQTRQCCFLISEYTFSPVRHNAKKFIQFFDNVVMRAKPVTIEDRRGKETGIAIHVTGLEDETTSVLYIKKNYVRLYRTQFGGSIDFKRFTDFIIGYRTEISL